MTSTIATTGTTGITKTAYIPVIKLTELERVQKSSEHEFGICDTCDTGLDNREDFVCSVVEYVLHVRCNNCHYYYEEEESIATMCGLIQKDEFS